MGLQAWKSSRLIHLWFAVSYFTTGLSINFLQCILYLTLHKIDKRLYRKINYYLCYSLYSLLVCLVDWWSGTKLYIYAKRDEFDKYFGKEHAYCVMNHTYEVDWIMGWMVTERLRMLGNCKAYAKKVIQYVPVLGWCWKFSEFVFLERSFEKDRKNIITQVEALADHPDPMWLLLFPEGTRFSAKKQEASRKFATERNYKQMDYHLQPRTRGFIASLPGMKGKVPAVYDILLAFNDNDAVKPTITSILFGKPLVGHMYMNRIPMEDVPKSEEDQDKFMRDMFHRKDRLRDSFVKTGDFFATSGEPRWEKFEVGQKRIFPLLNMLFWNTLTLVSVSYAMISLLLAGRLILFSLCAGILLAFYFLLIRTISMSKISKQSSYGSSANGNAKQD